MNVKVFLNFVEIQTKLASLFPFIFGVLFAYYLYGEINIYNTIVMYISLICIDMATTAINNYMDFKKAKDDYFKYNINVIGKNNVSPKLAVNIIFALLITGIIFGLLLVKETGLVVLLVGAISFCVGVFYTYGFMPISRMPIGEPVSGLVMGFLITYLAFYIQDTSIAQFSIENFELIFRLDILQTIVIFLVSLPFVFVIFNLMLGNNIHDINEDIKNERFLLPYYIGLENAILLFKTVYILVFVVVFFNVLVGILPKTTLIMFLILPKVLNNVKMYDENRSNGKGACFKYVVINMVLISVTYILTLMLGVLI